MPELFLELFSEEIPARMQARAAEDFSRLLSDALAPLAPAGIRTFHGPRRIAVAAEVAGSVPAGRSSERGPRRSAPEQALAGFLRKHGATREQLREEGDFWVLDRVVPGIDAGKLIAEAVPGVLRRFPWPKSMRWGGTSGFTWVRPLRRIVCLLDGAVVPFDLRDGDDDGHGLVSGDVTEGHRFLSPGAFPVASCADWAARLRARHVIVEAAERRRLIADGLRDLAATLGLAVVEDPGLLDEVCGLVEWPVPLIGAIDPAFMDLPPEVMQVSMRVNQRYFSLRDGLGRTAPFFAFVANIAAPDGGAAIIAGNERVLRARFADARHFWDLDRTRTLESRVAALDAITFHARLGSQGDRVRRMVRLAGVLAEYTQADRTQAERAALLAKADLTTGMVGEFPELQGVMGGYYARHDGEDTCVADAMRDHYAPKGPTDDVPELVVAITVALADKLDLLTGFFAIGEKPTGSGDPYALRRAALGVIRILTENRIRASLSSLIFEGLRLNVETALRNHIGIVNDLIGAEGVASEPGTDRYPEVPSVRALCRIQHTAARVLFDRETLSSELLDGTDRFLKVNDDHHLLTSLRNVLAAFGAMPFNEADGQARAEAFYTLPFEQAITHARSSASPLGDHVDSASVFALNLTAMRDHELVPITEEILAFILERLRVQLRAEGARYDVLNAVLGTGVDDDIARLLARTEAVAEMLGTEDGKNMLAAYRRAANILRIEEKKDGPHDRALDPGLLEAAEEIALAGALDRAEPAVTALLGGEKFAQAMTEFAALRPFLDAFFSEVTVNDARPALRLNRLALLARVRAVMGRVADFSRIEG